jgi:CDP-diglyceride synthetase
VLVLLGFWMAHLAFSLVAAKVSITNLAKESLGISYILVGFATTLGLAQFTIHKGAPYFQQTPDFFNGLGILLVLILIWTNDSFAYLVGRFLGRTKAVPALSPAKTVEGYAGGFAATLLVAWMLGSMLVPGLDGYQSLVLGAVISLAASLGDLFESAMKREAGVKDSGSLIPGHGGILDRLDAMLMVSPILMAVLLLLHYS